MAKRTHGIDDLVDTLIKQHGIHAAIRRAHDQLGTIQRSTDATPKEAREFIWTCTLWKLRNIRDSVY